MAVPDGVAPGESFEANVGGVITRVTVPAVDELGGAAPTELVVESPAAPVTFVVDVPAGVPPGGVFEASVGGQLMKITVPPALPPAGTGVAGAAAALLAPAAQATPTRKKPRRRPATPSSVDDSSSSSAASST